MPYKGRNALLDTISPPEPGTEIQGARRLPLALIDANPAQSRQVFDEQALKELAVSIAEHDVLEPILVRPVGDRYQVVAGERRTRAARLAGLADIPALIRAMTDEQAAYATAIENLQREDLDLEDEVRYLAYLQELSGLSGRALAEQLGKSRNYVADRLLLANRADLLAAYRTGSLSLHQAVDLARRGEQAESVLWEDTAILPSYTAASVLREDTAMLPSQIAPTPPPRPVERAALDQADGTGDTRRIPYRARAWDTVTTTLLRLDWQTVPAPERATFVASLDLLERAIQEARRELAIED